MTKTQKKAARDLAVAYSAFNDANDNTSRRVWARALSDAQSATGIEIVAESSLQYWIRQADKAAA